MTLNMGSIDRIIRGILGIILILLPFVSAFGAGSALLTWGAVIIGLVFAVTAVTGFCPLYRILGVNTCRM